MATLNQFKQEIAKLVVAQKAAKSVNAQYSVYFNRGLLHAMYTAYYILKHKLTPEQKKEYTTKVIAEWKSLGTNGWCGYCGFPYEDGHKRFLERVDSLIEKYSE